MVAEMQGMKPGMPTSRTKPDSILDARLEKVTHWRGNVLANLMSALAEIVDVLTKGTAEPGKILIRGTVVGSSKQLKQTKKLMPTSPLSRIGSGSQLDAPEEMKHLLNIIARILMQERMGPGWVEVVGLPLLIVKGQVR